jgi:hypothetical protein
MTLDNYISLVSSGIAFAGLLLVARQLRESTKQEKLQSMVKIYGVNRKLLSLGFDHPSLFTILKDAKGTDPVWERRYLQLWLNQFLLIHSYLKDSVFKGELKDGLIRDLSDFLTQENMLRHWQQHGSFYPVSFQKLVNGIIKKNEPPAKSANLRSGS